MATLNELLEELANSKAGDALAEWLETPGNTEKLTRTINVLLLGLAARRFVKRGLVAGGLSEDQAKRIGTALSWAAYLIGSGFTTGQRMADDVHDETYGDDDSPE